MAAYSTSKIRRTRSLRMFSLDNSSRRSLNTTSHNHHGSNKNKISSKRHEHQRRHHQPIVTVVTFLEQQQQQQDDVSILTTELDLSTSVSQHSSFDDDMSSNQCHNHHHAVFLDESSFHSRNSSRCCFQPDDSYEWGDIDQNDLQDLSVRPAKRRSITKRGDLLLANKKEEDENGSLSSTITDFVQNRINTFTNNIEFLAQKWQLQQP